MEYDIVKRIRSKRKIEKCPHCKHRLIIMLAREDYTKIICEKCSAFIYADINFYKDREGWEKKAIETWNNKIHANAGGKNGG